MGFSMVESLAAHGFYETSKQQADGGKTQLKEIIATVGRNVLGSCRVLQRSLLHCSLAYLP